MDTLWPDSLQRHFGAALDMLESALRTCPDDLWQARILGDGGPYPEFSEYWYVIFHALFWLDLYLSGAEEGFAPPEPFTMSETVAYLMPPRLYSKLELLDYIAHNRQKSKAILSALTDGQAHRKCKFPWGELTYAELLIDNLRHLQEHAAQLNLFLGQRKGAESRWVA